MSKIVVDGVSKRFRLRRDAAGSVKELFTRRHRDRSEDHFWALKDVSLEIEEGSMYALIGHNGSGKSTLLRCIAGIYRPDEGSVRVSGRVSTLLELGAGFHPDLSGRENVFLNATILGMNKREIERKFDDIVDFAGVSRFIDAPVKTYSTGMYVRLGFSVAVHVQPEILIIDEVIAVGDEEFQRKCFDHLYTLRKQGVTVVVVTHGMGTVETMCDSAAWLDHGVLQLEGPAPSVANAYLKRVNDAEAAARAPAGSGAALAGDFDNRGSDIVIDRVEFRDEADRPVDTVEHGHELRIAIRYRVGRPVEEPVFGYGIHAENGAHVCGTNTSIAGVRTGRLEQGTGEAVFTIERFPLIPGNYEITIVITDEHLQHVFDRHQQAYRLIVRRGDVRPGVGVVEIPGTWELTVPSSGAVPAA